MSDSIEPRMDGMGTEAFAVAPSSGLVRRTANGKTLNCSLAPSHHGEAGAVCPLSAEAFLPPLSLSIRSVLWRVVTLAGVLRGLRCEHFLQDREGCCEGAGSDSSEPPAQTLAIDCAQLVHCDKPRAIAETTAYTPGVSLPSCGHRRHNDGSQMLIQLIG